jgi:hypothetical protein
VYDQKEIVKDDIKFVVLVHNLTHNMNFVEEVLKGAFFFKEVLNRLSDKPTKEILLRDEEEKSKIAKEQFILLLAKD